MAHLLKQPHPDESNLRMERIRKTILKDVLEYNIRASQERKKQTNHHRNLEQQQFEQLNKREIERIKTEEELKRNSIIHNQNMLKDEYQRQIKEKRYRQNMEKQYDAVYANIEKDYQVFRNERRIYDLKKMYNRRSYEAKIEDKGRLKIKTEPDNPQSYDIGHSNEYLRHNQSQQKYRGHQMSPSPHNPEYKDSLDDLTAQKINLEGGSKYFKNLKN